MATHTYRAPNEVAEQYIAYNGSVHSTEKNDLEDWDWNTMTPKGPPIDITDLETRDFFEDEESQPLSNEAFNTQLGAPPGTV